MRYPGTASAMVGVVANKGSMALKITRDLGPGLINHPPTCVVSCGAGGGGGGGGGGPWCFSQQHFPGIGSFLQAVAPHIAAASRHIKIFVFILVRF